MDLWSFLEERVHLINADEGKQLKIKQWVNGYRGKIITFVTDASSCHLVFTKEKAATLHRGEYSSSELVLRGPDNLILKVLRGEANIDRESKAGNLRIWCNFHEWFPFLEIIKR